MPIKGYQKLNKLRGQFTGCLCISTNVSPHECCQLSRQFSGCLSTSTEVRFHECGEVSCQLSLGCPCISTNASPRECDCEHELADPLSDANLSAQTPQANSPKPGSVGADKKTPEGSTSKHKHDVECEIQESHLDSCFDSSDIDN